MAALAQGMVTLVGMPGSGKSSAGRHVARRFSLPFVDCDQWLVAQFGMSIADYFALHGEAAFREAEAATLAQIVQTRPACVLSTGGGAVLRADNRLLLRQHGTVVYLRAQPDEIYRRLRHDTKRPLLQVDDPREKLRQMFAQRDPLYREAAHLVIDAGRGSVQALARQVVGQLEKTGMRASPPQRDT